MIRINLENEEDILKNHVQKVQEYINFEALQNREKSFIKQNIEYILKAKPDEFENVISMIKQNNIDNNRLKKAFVGGKDCGGSIGYSKFSSKGTTTYNAYALAQKLKVNVCPYCNRNFINPIYKENSVGTDNKNQSPDIEHFFPKSIYPFLSLSISNLLPSCAFCNKIKSDVDTFQHNCLSPYEIKNSDFRFDFSLELNQVKEVKLISKTDCKNSEILHLESLYNEVHSKYINDIFKDVLKYPKSLKTI